MTFANVVIKSYLLKRYVGDDSVFTQGPPPSIADTKGGVRVAPLAQLKTKFSRTVGSLILK
jgi:hypothetical protein